MKKVEATGAERTIVYHYGLNGELIGETIYDDGGARIGERDYLWLDDLPVAQSEREFSGSTVTSDTFVYLHTDQLNTPRLATDSGGDVVWRWDSDAFGVGDADLDPDADTTEVSVRLRFPGQYLDDETGVHYNYFRDYDPVIGRYPQPDPIGLLGGVNTFSYALNNSIGFYDPYGLWVPPSLPQGVLDFTTGIGDGILATLSLGFVRGQSLRDSVGVDGGIDQCSRLYRGGRIAGTVATLGANAFGAIPRTLTHYTTSQAAARSIVQSGIRPSRFGLSGGGSYASSIGRFPRNPLVPPGAGVPVTVTNTSGYVRTVFPGTFLRPTASGVALTTAWYGTVGAYANRDVFDECMCSR